MTVITPLRRFLVGVIIAGLAAVGLVSIPAPTTAEAAKIYKYSQLSSGRRADLAATDSIQKHAVSKSHKLDYKKANKYDKGRTTARRKFAAGFLWAGGKITGISSAELKKVKKYIPKKRAPYHKLSDARFLPDAPKKCTGVTKYRDVYVKGPAFDRRYYLNSCDTDLLLASTDSAAILAGVIAVLIPPSAPGSGAVAGFLLIGNKYITYQQGRSDLDAIIIRDYTHLLTVQPQ